MRESATTSAARAAIDEVAVRVLLIAYEFPPSPSPQSLRWARLARELAKRGVQVHVLSVQREGEQVRIAAPPGIVIDRTPSGLVTGLIAHFRAQHQVERPVANASSMPADRASHAAIDAPAALNWKGRLVERANRIAGGFTFPDAFGQWEPAARLRLAQVLHEFDPEVVVSSHEPANTLRLGRIAKERGFAWLADLGDPVLSAYTPRRWRKQALAVEAWTCRHADHVIVTTEAAKRLLVSRHGVAEARFSVLPQGFDASHGEPADGPLPLRFDPELLELVYTGSFYAFRRPQALVESVLANVGVRLTIATRNPPEWLAAVAVAHADRIRMTGFLRHEQAVALQKGADVLVNLANDDPVQIPGKVFEYLGAGRPVLHIGGGEAVATLLSDRRRGIVVADRADAIGEALCWLRDVKRAGDWQARFDLRPGRFPEYEWSRIGATLYEMLCRLVPTGRRP